LFWRPSMEEFCRAFPEDALPPPPAGPFPDLEFRHGLSCQFAHFPVQHLFGSPRFLLSLANSEALPLVRSGGADPKRIFFPSLGFAFCCFLLSPPREFLLVCCPFPSKRSPPLLCNTFDVLLCRISLPPRWASLVLLEIVYTSA